MQRWLSVLLGLGVLVVAVLLAAKGWSVRPRGGGATMDASSEDGGTVSILEALPDASGEAGAQSSAEARSGIGFHMPDGTPVPPLPDKPQRVHFGVVLISYAGAQGASEKARSQREAREIADKLAADAKADFHAAVVRGDSGSIDDVGSMPRGVLEPAVEYEIFTLPVGAVSGPLDTPRGYWIVKRTE